MIEDIDLGQIEKKSIRGKQTNLANVLTSTFTPRM